MKIRHEVGDTVRNLRTLLNELVQATKISIPIREVAD
jgi:hypothetical protein